MVIFITVSKEKNTYLKTKNAQETVKHELLSTFFWQYLVENKKCHNKFVIREMFIKINQVTI